MKKLLLMLLAVTVAFTACDQQKSNANDNEQNAVIDSLKRVITQKDNEINDVVSTMNEIQEGLRLISEAENRVTISQMGEGTSSASKIKDDLRFIADKMQKNRELISKLRQQLRQSSLDAEQLKTTLDNLTMELDAKDKELQRLRQELEAKDIRIADLDRAVTTLNENVNELSDENQKQSQTISNQDKQLHTGWYVFGTKKELKDQHIVENDRVLQSNFNKSYFTKVDIRVDKEIKLYSKSAKLLTSHPASSYTLQLDANKQYVLRITNPDSFWGTSKYLVILVK